MGLLENLPWRISLWTKHTVSATVWWMRASGSQQGGKQQPDVIDFVPKQELERAQREIEKQQREIERLQRENQRLRKELEAALRASKRQAAPHFRGEPKADPQRPGRKSGSHYGQQT